VRWLPFFCGLALFAFLIAYAGIEGSKQTIVISNEFYRPHGRITDWQQQFLDCQQKITKGMSQQEVEAIFTGIANSNSINKTRGANLSLPSDGDFIITYSIPPGGNDDGLFIQVHFGKDGKVIKRHGGESDW
jgi:hypothetical protein